MYTYIFISAFIITLSALSGIIFSWKLLSGWIETRLRYLIAVASGVFLAIAFNMLKEAVLEGNIYHVVTAFIFGIVFILGATKLMPHHHEHGPHPEHNHSKIDARRVLVGDAVHNIHDGIILVPAFLVSNAVGIATAGGILLHETVQEISQFFILREVGYTVKQSLLRNLLAQLTIWLGIILSLSLASVHELEIPLIAFAGGGFTYILVQDLLPSVIRHAKSEKRYFSYSIAFLFGLALMFTVITIVPHEHAEELELPDGFGLAQTTTASLTTYDAVV